MTPFNTLTKAAGLSQQEVAALLDITLDAVKSYSIGRRKPSVDVLNKLIPHAEKHTGKLHNQVLAIKYGLTC